MWIACHKTVRFLIYSLLFLSLSSPLLHADSTPAAPNKVPEMSIVNFGIVIQNEHYQIYRSRLLGKLGLSKIDTYFKENDLTFPKTIVYMNRQGYRGPLFLFAQFAITEYELQNTYGFNFYHSFGYDYRTYLDGRNPYEPEDDIDRGRHLNAKAKKLFGEIKDDKKDGGVGAFIRILELVLDRDKQPVLYHCFGGKHRTGMITLAIRYMQGGDWIHGEKTEVKSSQDGEYYWLNPAEYEYHLYNKKSFRKENLDFVKKFSKDERFLALKKKYQPYLH